MISHAAILTSMEQRASRAITQELRQMRAELLALREQLSDDDRAHADALELKLEHLETQQCAPSVAPRVEPVYLAPELQIDEAESAQSTAAMAATSALNGKRFEPALANA